jgi:S1-C subfamily serine protease
MRGTPGRPAAGAAMLAALTTTCALLLGMGIGVVAMGGDARTGAPGAPLSPAAPAPPQGRPYAQPTQAGTPDQVAAGVEPAVVRIESVVSSTGRQIVGAGVNLSPNGEVITCEHVIHGASSVVVTISGHPPHRARIAGADPSGDLAVLQIFGASGLPIAVMADSSTLAVGDRVVAIGFPLNQGGSMAVTSGSVVGLHRGLTEVNPEAGTTRSLRGLIASDAPVAPGNSGGPLINARSEVVGLVAAGDNLDGGTAAIGYAIPSNTALDEFSRVPKAASGYSTSASANPTVGSETNE